MRLLALVLVVLAATPAVARAETAEPRTIISLVDLVPPDTLKYSRVHQLATMPLNHLGLVVEQHNIADGLPDLDGRDDVRGILTWLSASERTGAYDFLDWAERQIAAGRRFVVLGGIGALEDRERGAVPLDRLNRFLGHLGVRFEGSFVTLPVGMTYLHTDPLVWGFEDRPAVPPSFPVLRIARSGFTTHVEVGRAGDPARSSAVVVTGPSGGIAVEGFVADIDFGNVIRRWRINPFRFFALAFGTDDLPKPDTTTLVGRRIYYSHVDGDGWRSQSAVRLGERQASSAEVMLERIVARYPDLPVTIAPIAAEMDPDWMDDPVARETARRLFELPQVEPASHTYTHPFQWSFFRNYDAARERQVVGSKGAASGNPDGYTLHGEGVAAAPAPEGGNDLGSRYEVPRAFYAKPFDLELEIAGSLRRLQELAGDRPIAVLQWSGDTTPFEAAVRSVRQAGIPNINGGDTRFDAEFPSYGFVAPIGIRIGAERQIYASNSNENTYTDLWSGRFFGFRHLQETLARTGSPIRVKPINIYYHTYSAERVASLNALIDNLEYARRQAIVPIRTSHFARIAQGFYRTRLVALPDGRWRVEDRGELQTVRFDRATLRTVDLDRSSGVLGFNHLHGSLYVALDPDDDAPVIALGDDGPPYVPAAGSRPYLLESRWPTRDLRATATQAAATVGGFGPGEMTWIVPTPGPWRVTLAGHGGSSFQSTITVGDDRRLTIVLPSGHGEAGALTLAAIGP